MSGDRLHQEALLAFTAGITGVVRDGMETFALTITKTPPICAGEYRAEFKAAWNGRGYSHHRYRYW